MPGQAKLEDSNVANIGGKDHKNAVKAVAANAPEWKGAGAVVGKQVWRIENFKVVAWPKRKYGTFYTGDSYIILHTYKVEQKIQYNVHFWLGRETTADESGTAAYKTVELDTLLGDLPVQFRECQGFESKQFLKLFKDRLTYLDGGVASGFKHVTPEEYKPRLMHFKGKNPVRVEQVPLELKSLNDGDVFMLDMGLSLIQWNGTTSGAWEKRKAREVASEIKEGRRKRVEYLVLDGDEDHDVFWTTLGGKGQVAPATPDTEIKDTPPVLYQLSDASGSMQIEEVDLKRSSLKNDDVFILDAHFQIVIWVGSGASKQEKSSAIPHATSFLEKTGRPMHTPIIRVVQGGHAKTHFDKYLN